MKASREQRSRAREIRGYSESYINQACTCGCIRADHSRLTKNCTRCHCAGFLKRENTTTPRKFCFGTLPQAVVTPQPEAPAPEAETQEASPEAELETTVIPREAAARCPFCLENDFDSAPAVKCTTCNAWVHADCVQLHGRCPACNAGWAS